MNLASKCFQASAFILAFGVSADCAAGQPVTPDTRIRVEARDTFQGTYLGVRADSLLIMRDGTRDTTAVALPSIHQIDVSRGVHGRTLRGMGIGFGSGALLGFAIGASYRPPQHPDGPYASITSLGVAAALGSGLGIAGTVIGGVFGAMCRSEHWRVVVSPAYGFSPGTVGLARSYGAR